ncbi:helix-turn-helix transcriptional regulator [Streptomyces jietaisiensis]|uniref:Helix-turn-helix transcriptional regulator n=1 Tax=Streptomyces griseoaurantiacus TaxID=68213 RepID=A0ABZ1V3S6_9ACTN|nr:helix-turn-helix transcriptional regulator [Streptomyces jietaisiensis]
MPPTVNRTELREFLRSRRARVSPEDVGIPATVRRRTPGLRREEVAQLAGIGITWYTWLEQGRPINVSSQVLDAVARTLFLSAAEREHLYRLAEVPQPPAISDPPIELPGHLDSVLGALDPLPAMLVDGRTDVLRWNRAYAALHPALVSAPPGRRNTLWQLFAAPEEQPRIVNREEQAPEAVAGFRYRYSQNAGDARWQDFVARLCTASPLFSRLWATHDVAPPHLCDKRYDIPGIGEVSLRATSMELTDHPGVRLVVQTPTDESSRENVDRLLRRATHV